MTECIETEVLIIGCGVAGGTVALQLADLGIPVTITTRSGDQEKSSTHYAQGGIVYRGNNDSVENFSNDLFQSGNNHNNPTAVRILANEGPRLIDEILIEKLGIEFDKNTDGTLSLVREGGHQVARILHVEDATGKAIQQSILKNLEKHPNVQFLKNITAVDLLTPSHHSLNRLAVYEPSSVVGAYLFNRENKSVIRCIAKKTVIATGGLGQIYLRTTNPPGARGDGIAMAYRAGARVINNEFIQFHPTMFYHEYKPNFLISEAVRGAGARLVNKNGQPFMQKYEPEWKDLAPRDLVARSIHKEIIEQGVTNVFLDLHSYIKGNDIKERFPNIYSSCLQNGVDIAREPAPIVPAAHYACGGIWVDQWSRTSLENFYAVGEAACTGVHGANRLASTSLLEGLIWGNRAAQDIAKTIKDYQKPKAEDIPPWQPAGSDEPDPALISQDMSSIKNIMWNYVGLVRNAHRLQRALRELRNLENEIERFYRVTKLSDGIIGLRNAIRTAIIVTSAAWSNKRSMGCHYREN
ncbi:MAG: L-aspartate oxidase [Calditrichaceae bacterium]|nr:L-aspartate oxidase [Calditrichaceae bacterium]